MGYPAPVLPDNRKRGADYPYTDKTRVGFGGMNHQRSATDGEWFQTMNMTSDYYPVMASREPRMHVHSLDTGSAVTGMCGGDSIYTTIKVPVSEGDPYDGIWKTHIVNGKYEFQAINLFSLQDSEKLMCKMGSRLIVFPDKKCYDETNNILLSLEASADEPSITFYSGTYMGEEATANCIQLVSESVDYSQYFKAGQAVTISGCSHSENNITAIIREYNPAVDAYSIIGTPTKYVINLHFYENTFWIGDSETTVYKDSRGIPEVCPGYADYDPPGSTQTMRHIKREVPDLDVLFVHENRLWGAKDDTIYASALGDPFTWYNYDTVDTACWYVDVLSEGNFTGGCSFLGYPVFFKDNHIYKVYGSVPSDFSLAQSADIGVAPGSGASLAIANEKLYYLSRVGVMEYTGALPRLISDPAFGDRFMKDGIGASDGIKYRISCHDTDALTGENNYHHFVYDTQNGCWHEEDNYYYHMAWGSGNLYVNTDAYIDVLGDPSLPSSTYPDMEDEWIWYAESADFTESSPRRKWVGAPLDVRAELQNSLGEEIAGKRVVLGAGFAVYIRYNDDPQGDDLLIGAFFTTEAAAQEVLGIGSTAPWQTVAEGKRSFICTQIPIRTDYYRLIIKGIGRVWIYSISPYTEQGSTWHGVNGR